MNDEKFNDITGPREQARKEVYQQAIQDVLAILNEADDKYGQPQIINTFAAYLRNKIAALKEGTK